MTAHLGYGKGEHVGRSDGNARNGTKGKTVQTGVGPVPEAGLHPGPPAVAAVMDDTDVFAEDHFFAFLTALGVPWFTPGRPRPRAVPQGGWPRGNAK